MDKQTLLIKMRGINKWIEENPDVTEPNMYELIDCVTELGVIARKEGIGKNENKFPEPNSDLVPLYREWNKMYKSRVSLDRARDPKFSVNVKTKLYEYFSDLNMRCCIGEFRFPGMDIDETKLNEEDRAKLLFEREECLEAIKKIGSISLYINQEKMHNPDFVYDNKSEYESLMKKVEKHEQYMPKHYKEVIADIEDNMVISVPSNPGEDDELIV